MLKFQGITKSFGSFKANDQISFEVKNQTIHAIVGENGAGKSTLMKILFGIYQADSGQIFFKDRPISFNSPLEAKKSGIGMVHQHFMLAEKMTAIDHVILDSDQTTSPLKSLDRKNICMELEKFAKQFDMSVPWEEPIENLSVGMHQRIEILKLLKNNSDLLILDEPTAVLAPKEIESFFQQLRELKSLGKTIIIITHKIKEVLALADSVTVLRQGRSIATVPTQELDFDKLSELIIGRLPQKMSVQKNIKSNEVLLSIEQINSSRAHIHNLNFRIYRNEIVGIAGIEGNGQSDLIQFLLNPIAQAQSITGQAHFLTTNILGKSTRQLKDLGICFFPEDRLRQGLIPDWLPDENFLLGQQHKPIFSNFGILLWRLIKTATKNVFHDFSVQPENLHQPLASFSGGNQQKFVVGRELSQNPKLLIASHPTRGVDIGAIESIHQHLIHQRDAGSGILLISSELDELMKLSNRILVFFNGRIVKEFFHTDFDEKEIGAYMLGQGS